MKVSAKTKQHPVPVSVEVNIPEKLEDLTKSYGAEVVAAAARGAIIISLQAAIRRQIDKGAKHEEIQKSASAWKPDVRSTVKVTAFEKTVSSIDKLSPEERKALLEKLTAKTPHVKAA